MTPGPLDDAVLPVGVRSRFLDDVNGLGVHILEAGAPADPCVPLLQGFPELERSWRNVMPAPAESGFHVVAPDLRGHGRITGGSTNYDGDLRRYYTMNVVRDVCGVEDDTSTMGSSARKFGATEDFRRQPFAKTPSLSS